jgi:hypothetical protein
LGYQPAVPEYFRLPNVNLFFDVLSFADPLVFLAH